MLLSTRSRWASATTSVGCRHLRIPGRRSSTARWRKVRARAERIATSGIVMTGDSPVLRKFLRTESDYTLTAVRLVLGFVFFVHGAQVIPHWLHSLLQQRQRRKDKT